MTSIFQHYRCLLTAAGGCFIQAFQNRLTGLVFRIVSHDIHVVFLLVLHQINIACISYEPYTVDESINQQIINEDFS